MQLETEYFTYNDKVAYVNRTHDDDKIIVPSTIKNFFEPIILQSLWIMGQIPWENTIEDSTYANVNTWFENFITSAPHNLAERGRYTVEAVKYEFWNADHADGSIMFVFNAVK